MERKTGEYEEARTAKGLGTLKQNWKGFPSNLINFN